MRRLTQQLLEVDDPQVTTGRRLQRWAADEDRRRERRRDLFASDEGQRLGDRRLGREDDRLAGHQAARAVLVVGHQPSDRLRLVWLHPGQQPLAVGRRELGEQVGGIVGLHRLQDVGGPLVVQAGEDLHLVVLGELLEDVGQAIVVQRGRDLPPPVAGQIVDRIGEVGDGSVTVCREQRCRVALARVGVQARDVGDVDQERLAPASVEVQPASGRVDEFADVHLRHGPCLGPDVHGEVLDGGVDARAGVRVAGVGRLGVGRLGGCCLGGAAAWCEPDDHPAFAQAGDGQHLSGAGFEPAQVDHAGRDHLALLQRGHPGRRDEHPFAARNLDDQADDPGRGRRRGIPGGGRGIPGGHGHDDVVHPTHLVSQGVEHRQPGELG